MNIQDDDMSLKMSDNMPAVLDSALTTYDVSANESEYVEDMDDTLTKSSNNNHNNMDWATGVTRQNTVKESTVSSCSTEKVTNPDQTKIEINEIKTETSESIDVPFLTQQSVVTVVDKEENSINKTCEQESDLMMIPQEILTNTSTSSVDQTGTSTSDSTTSGVNSGHSQGQNQITDTMSEDYNAVVKNSMFEMAAQTLQQIWPKEFDSWPIEQTQVYLTNGPDSAVLLVNNIVEEGERIRIEREQKAILNLMALVSPTGAYDSGSNGNYVGQFAKSF